MRTSCPCTINISCHFHCPCPLCLLLSHVSILVSVWVVTDLKLDQCKRKAPCLQSNSPKSLKCFKIIWSVCVYTYKHAYTCVCRYVYMYLPLCFNLFTSECIGEMPFQQVLIQFSSSNRLENTPRTGYLPFPVSLPYSPTRAFWDHLQGNYLFSNSASGYESKGTWNAGHLASFPRIQDVILDRENLHPDKRVTIRKQHQLAVINEGTMAPSLHHTHSSRIVSCDAVLGVCDVVM